MMTVRLHPVPMLYTSVFVSRNYVMNACLWLLVGILCYLPQLAHHRETPGSRETVVDGWRR